MHQLHGDTLAVNPEATPYEQPSCLEADGCCTDKPGQALLVKAADCQQILLAHNSGRYVAALHVGWRGNRLGFPETGLAGFCAAYNLNAADVLAVRGPSLGPGRAEFVHFAREWPAKYTPWFNPASRCMDLWSLTKHQLLRAGLKPENIFGIDLCTNALREMFFSHRAKSVGRQAAVIFIR
jgi:YfiH family protein